MWGGHDECAPLGYGIVIIDYVTSTLISAQGYAAPDKIDSVDKARWKAFEAAGLILNPQPMSASMPYMYGKIKLPFSDVRIGRESAITPEIQAWAEENIGLSVAERSTWLEYIRNRDSNV